MSLLESLEKRVMRLETLIIVNIGLTCAIAGQKALEILLPLLG